MKKMLPFKWARGAAASALIGAVALVGGVPTAVQADETCMSPYMAKIVGQEDYVYVWTLGVEGMGDEQDKLVTISVNPDADNYGEVAHILSVGGRNEAHHSGLSDDRRFLWAGGLDSNKIFIFDIHSDPAAPKLHKVITNFVDKTGGMVGPHTFYALPGRIMVSALSNNVDHGGRTGMAEYTSEGEFVAAHWFPTDSDLRGADKTGNFADGYGYDVRVLPRVNAMFTSSFTGWSNYMMDFGQMLSDPEAMKRFGNTMVVWDLHTRKPKKVFDVPGAPLEIRCAWAGNNNYCFTTTALTSKIWLIYLDENEEWQAEDVADIGDPSKVPLPVDISITADDKGLWVQTFMDGKTRYFDITDPHHPKQTYEHKIGSQVNMISQSWDGKRAYFTTSLLGSWDKTGKDDEQWFKLYHWNGKKLDHQFTIDFYQLKLGRAHQMRFGAYSLYSQAPNSSDTMMSQVEK
jgi:selenium-binding protein 1